MFLRALKAVLQERLMGHGLGFQSKAAGTRPVSQLEPMQLVSLQSPVLTAVAVLLMVLVEGFGGLSALPRISSTAAGLVALSCFAATSMNFAGMCAIRKLGAPASQLAGKLNVFVTTALSSAFFGDELTAGEVCGGMVALAGLAIYEKAQKRAQKRQKEQQETSGSLPGRDVTQQSCPPEAACSSSSNTASVSNEQSGSRRGFASPSAILGKALRPRIDYRRGRIFTGAGVAEYEMHAV